MSKYKVVVYAIAKNEAKYAEAWAKNMSEADEIYVLLDPTSSDGTKEILEKNGVIIKEKLIKPWRFDKARNESLKLVPKDADICVCTDLDELFNPGWREMLENVWEEDTNQAVYKYYHNAGSKEQAPNIFDYSKIHDRKSFKWKWIIHEYIVAKTNKPIKRVVVDGLMLKHYPDTTKKRDYKALLEMAVKKAPKDKRYLSLLQEEYFNAKDYNNAKACALKLLKMKDCGIVDCCLAYKFLVASEYEQGNYAEAKKYCYVALSKCDYCKHFYAELGKIAILIDKDYSYGIGLFNKALSITKEVMASRELEWKDDALIYNYISMAYFYLNDFVSAIKYIDLSINLKPKEETYIKNKQIYLDALNKE